MTNYVASTTINFERSRFYVRPGDLLSYDPQHSGGSLAIYRNGQLVKVLRVESLAIEAFLKSRFISEVRAPAKSPEPPLAAGEAVLAARGIGASPIERSSKTATAVEEELGMLPARVPREDAGAITMDTLISGYASSLKAAEPAPDPHGLLTPPGDPPLTSPHLTGFKRLLPEYPAGSSDLDELGNTPAAQTQMDALCKVADEAIEAGVPQTTGPYEGKTMPKHPAQKRKKPQRNIIDPVVRPPDPPPSQVLGPEEEPEQPEQNRISEP
jgi:hypothetical protein